MEGSAKVEGLEGVLKALQVAFPNDKKKQQSVIHSAMGGSARKTILQFAKELALRGDSSGALSESLAVRVQPKRRRQGKAGGMEIVPVRYNKKAMALYIKHYYTAAGINPDSSVVIDGIRHGHLVEFGTFRTAAYPFLWPAAMLGSARYRSLFASELMKGIESRVKREAKKHTKHGTLSVSGHSFNYKVSTWLPGAN